MEQGERVGKAAAELPHSKWLVAISCGTQTLVGVAWRKRCAHAHSVKFRYYPSIYNTTVYLPSP